ncbi:MAG TPA: alpha/beta fold hydrolase [Gaiellaceae bacterium]
MAERSFDVTTPDGRTLRVHEAGDADGAPVLAHHGTPGVGTQYGPHAEDAARRGIRLLSYDRAGYGGSTPAPGRTVADVAVDTATIADALDLERLGTWGISGGGPHALACAALLPDRIGAAVSIAGPAPLDARGLDWSAGMGESNLAEFDAAKQGREALEPLLAAEADGMRRTDAATLAEALQSLLGAADAAALRGPLGPFLVDIFHAAVGGGIEGWLEDDLAFAAPWGFDLAAIRVPVAILHGSDDRFVPLAHGEWLANAIPGAESRISDDGHLTLLEDGVPSVHAWLLERV